MLGLPFESLLSMAGGNTAVATSIYLLQESLKRQQQQQSQPPPPLQQQQQCAQLGQSSDANALLLNAGLAILFQQMVQPIQQQQQQAGNLAQQQQHVNCNTANFSAPLQEQLASLMQGLMQVSSPLPSSTVAPIPASATASQQQQQQQQQHQPVAENSNISHHRPHPDELGDVGDGERPAPVAAATVPFQNETTEQQQQQQQQQPISKVALTASPPAFSDHDVRSPADQAASAAEIILSGQSPVEAKITASSDESALTPENSSTHPCHARAMPADHNASSAYFIVPNNVRHGQHLHCSHPLCRACGVKFRFCKVCNKPVTKQNFKSRHEHADIMARVREKSGGTVNSASSESNSSYPITKGAARHSSPPSSCNHQIRTVKPVDTRAMSSSSASIASANTSRNSSGNSLNRSRPRSREPLFKKRKTPSLSAELTINSPALRCRAVCPTDPGWTGTSVNDGTDHISEATRVDETYEPVRARRRWSLLFVERPDDIRLIGQWIQDVVDVSDQLMLCQSPMDRGGADATSSAEPVKSSNDSHSAPRRKSSVEEKWSRLLRERPDSHDRSAMHRWIFDALEISSA